MIRDATETDLEQILDLAETKRTEYAQFQPRFHRPAPDAREKQAPYFQKLIEDDGALVMVYDESGRIEGFIIAQIGPAPPVYDPGGLTCGVDDFAVRSPDLWATVGRALLDAVRIRARDRGAVQVIVVCGPSDLSKRDMLATARLSVASEWLVGEV